MNSKNTNGYVFVGEGIFKNMKGSKPMSIEMGIK